MLILGLITGLVLGALLMNLVVEEERKLRYEAEERAVTHFRKLNNIEHILKVSNKKKENYFITLDKIKRELVRPANQN